MAKASLQSLAKALSKFVVKEVVKKNKKSFETKITRAFERIKKQMIKEFLKHPVSVEILAGIQAYNSSGTLGGYGNLFTFIGFDKGSEPLNPIINILEESRIEYGIDSETGFVAKIYLPSSEQIFSETPMPWASGRSWAEGIERGISGFGQYLNTPADRSRSSEGIEIKATVRGGKFKNTTYVSALINKYSKKFEQIDKSVEITQII